MMDNQEFCVAQIKSLLSDLLERVDRAAKEIKTNNDEERLTVRVSLLNHFSKSHARLIARMIDQEHRAGRHPTIAAVRCKLDVFHDTLGMTLREFDKEDSPAADVSVIDDAQPSCFSPEI